MKIRRIWLENKNKTRNNNNTNRIGWQKQRHIDKNDDVLYTEYIVYGKSLLYTPFNRQRWLACIFTVVNAMMKQIEFIWIQTTCKLLNWCGSSKFVESVFALKTIPKRSLVFLIVLLCFGCCCQCLFCCSCLRRISCTQETNANVCTCKY